jgi:hypothetical protein
MIINKQSFYPVLLVDRGGITTPGQPLKHNKSRRSGAQRYYTTEKPFRNQHKNVRMKNCPQKTVKKLERC